MILLVLNSLILTINCVCDQEEGFPRRILLQLLPKYHLCPHKGTCWGERVITYSGLVNNWVIAAVFTVFTVVRLLKPEEQNCGQPCSTDVFYIATVLDNKNKHKHQYTKGAIIPKNYKSNQKLEKLDLVYTSNSKYTYIKIIMAYKRLKSCLFQPH